MKKLELLAPAGSYEALVAAVQNGCDALYLGGSKFGARAFANNFDDVQLKQAVQYAHRYGVRVFVTVNTLIKEAELDACMHYIQTLQDSDVDALILQDIGLFTYVHECFPDFELHASTQMHIHNSEGIYLLKEMGAARVVVPRETSIEEIAQYTKFGIDVEAFVQGALCVSYSGQCLLSAYTESRSGNRGECAQSCRMQYELIKQRDHKKEMVQTKGAYLLSPKDLNTIAQVPQLIEAGIASFKIEGRMKRPEYVALMVSTYRKAIDAYLDGKKQTITPQALEDMEKIFNRGFTSGHLFHAMGSSLMNINRPNHMGIVIGKVTGFHHDKVMITLTKELRQGDGIRILSTRGDEGFTINRIYKQGLLVNHANAFDDIEIDKTFYVEKGSCVVKTTDSIQLKQLQETYSSIHRRVPIHAAFSMHVDAYAELSLWDEEGCYVQQRSTIVCEKARTMPLDEERIQSQLQKTKDTPFDIFDIVFDIDNDGTLLIKELNQLRRDALEKFANKREVRNTNRLQKPYITTPLPPCAPLDASIIVCHTLVHYQACKDMGVKVVYIDDIMLYEQLREDLDMEVRLKTSRVMKEAYPKGTYMVEEHGGVYLKQPVICGTSCNVTNHHSARFLFSRNAQAVCFSLENTLTECIAIQTKFYQEYGYYGNFVYPVYGRQELMISEYCAINAQMKDNDKRQCGLCKQGEYALVDGKKRVFPIQCDEHCRMHLLSEDVNHKLHERAYAELHHITSFLYVFTKESYEECVAILKQIVEDEQL